MNTSHRLLYRSQNLNNFRLFLKASLCGSVGKVFVYYLYEFESRVK